MNTNLSQLVQRSREEAALRGSNATTVKGIAKYLKSHQVHSLMPGMRRLVQLEKNGSVSPYIYARVLPHQYLRAESERVSHPEAKRACSDKKFRASYTKKLRREEDRLAMSIAPSIDAGIAQHRNYPKIRARLGVILSEWRIMGLKSKRSLEFFPSNVCLVSVTPDLLDSESIAYTKKGRDFQCLPTYNPSFLHHVDGDTIWKNGRAVGYSRAVNDNYVHSVAWVSLDKKTLVYRLGEKERTLVIPAGSILVWDIDRHGVRVLDTTNPKRDYHPSAWFFRMSHTQASMMYSMEIHLERNYQVRLQTEAEEKVQQAKYADVWVSAFDSVAGGNCLEGTKDFAKKLGLNILMYYPAQEILDRAKEVGENMYRVNIAITSAMRRHMRDMRCGFSLIQDHFEVR